MRLFIVSALAIAFLAILFALQNTNLVTINLFLWSYQQSLALVLLGTLTLGVVIGLLVSIPAVIRRGWQTTRVQKQADHLNALLQEKTQAINVETQKVQAVKQSYRSLLAALSLIEENTGLLRHHLVNDAVTHQLQQMQSTASDSSPSSLSLLMLHVKPQQTEGANAHAVWAAIAQTLQTHAAIHTWFYSDGQGLFVATTPGLDEKALNQYGESLQKAVLEHPPLLSNGHQVALEVSVGGAISDTQTPVDTEQLVETARKALQQAQQRGRNRLRFLHAPA